MTGESPLQPPRTLLPFFLRISASTYNNFGLICRFNAHRYTHEHQRDLEDTEKKMFGTCNCIISHREVITINYGQVNYFFFYYITAIIFVLERSRSMIGFTSNCNFSQIFLSQCATLVSRERGREKPPTETREKAVS